MTRSILRREVVPSKRALSDEVLTCGLGDDLTPTSPVSLRVTPHPPTPHACTYLPCRQGAFHNLSPPNKSLKRDVITARTPTQTHICTHNRPAQALRTPSFTYKRKPNLSDNKRTSYHLQSRGNSEVMKLKHE
jgi:hypothetical protein